jgi:sterol desaturase/sphingolipid hydroxylase (fatty acid hydroxylase superfamily)
VRGAGVGQARRVSIIQASIPLFFLLLLVELAYAQVRGVRLLRLQDSITDLSLGTLSQLSGVFFKLVTIGIYIWVGSHLSFPAFLPRLAWPDGAPFVGADGFPGFAVRIPELISWTAAFVLVDFAYYWLHRLSHEVHVLWAGHVVHHSSEEYNLAVALRQSALHGLMSWVFYIPLAVIGVPWTLFVSCNALNLVYQFWIHTRAVGRLSPWAEYVLNTPSHHRVHHGVNPKYQDKNYAGVFITWDRLFGTFVEEEEEPVYGLTHALQSWNPLWANVHVFVEIWRLLRLTKGWRNKVRVVFGSPNWRPPEAGERIVPPEVTVDNVRKFSGYALCQFGIVLLASVKTLTLAATLPMAQTGALAFYIVLSLTNLGGLLEGEGWGYVLEQARLLSLSAACVTLLARGTLPALPVALLVGWFLFSALWLRSLLGLPAGR